MTTAPAVLGGSPAFPDGLPLVRPTIPDIPGLAQRLQAILESGILTNNRTAEMIKYASNVTLATMISLANELGRLCSAVGGIDVRDVTHGVHQSAYFTTSAAPGGQVTAGIAAFLEAGCGFGGSCLPKDVTALIAQGAGYGLQMPLLRSVLEINRSQPAEVMQLIARHYSSLRDVSVTVLGLAFKPDTDDIRESPAFPVIRGLKEAGARVTAYDPVAHPTAHEALTDVTLAGSLTAAIADAEIIVLVTRWPEFQQLEKRLAGAARQPLVVDGRRVLNPAAFARYEGIGR